MPHTKGEWFADEFKQPTNGFQGYVPVFCNNNAGGIETIAIVHKNNSDENSVTLSNARLIAAAPELLEALKLANEMLNDLYKTSDDYASDNVSHGKIRLAIAKAEGKVK